MGWYNYHLWEFAKGNIHYTDHQFEDPLNLFGRLPENAQKSLLSEVLTQEKDIIIYRYDFGDEWVHEIILEKILPPQEGVHYPRCVAGKLAAPPEDCGGMGGYRRMLESQQNPDDEEYDSIIEWLDEDFDPKKFNIKSINKQLDILNADLNSQIRKWVKSRGKRRKPKTKREWLHEIAEAYQEALDDQSVSETIDAPITDDLLYHMAPHICMQFRGIKVNEENYKKIVEGTLASYIVTIERGEGGSIIEESPLMGFCFCYLAAHFAADLLDEQKVEVLMDMCVDHMNALKIMIEQNH